MISKINQNTLCKDKNEEAIPPFPSLIAKIYERCPTKNKHDITIIGKMSLKVYGSSIQC